MQGLRPFRRYFDFAGRSGRAEYWQFIFIYVIAMSGAALIFMIGGEAILLFPVLVIHGIFIIPLLSATIRRFHDRGKSGDWVIVPVVGGMLSLKAGQNAGISLGGVALNDWLLLIIGGAALLILWQCLLPGDPMENGFGPPEPRLAG